MAKTYYSWLTNFEYIRLIHITLLFVNLNPINTLWIPLQNPVLDHVTPDSCGVIVLLGDNRVELLLGILGGGG
jgi:hypothetical protein